MVLQRTYHRWMMLSVQGLNLAASLAPRLALPLVAGARLRMVTHTGLGAGLGSAEPGPEK